MSLDITKLSLDITKPPPVFQRRLVIFHWVQDTANHIPTTIGLALLISNIDQSITSFRPFRPCHPFRPYHPCLHRRRQQI